MINLKKKRFIVPWTWQERCNCIKKKVLMLGFKYSLYNPITYAINNQRLFTRLNLAHKDVSICFYVEMHVQTKPHCVFAKVTQTDIYIYYNHL